MNEPKYFVCKHCGNVVEMLNDSGVKVVCCGEAMDVLEANTTDAAVEKHVPVVEIEGNKIKVQVGSVLHPMLEEHHIGWIWLQTESGGQRKVIEVGKEPRAEFILNDNDKALAVYEWCNLHGLWKKDI